VSKGLQSLAVTAPFDVLYRVMSYRDPVDVQIDISFAVASPSDVVTHCSFFAEFLRSGLVFLLIFLILLFLLFDRFISLPLLVHSGLLLC
jgi:hypothetical protein